MTTATATSPTAAASEPGLSATRFRGIDRRVAIAVLLALAVLIALLVPIGIGYTNPPSRHPGEGDLALYKHIVETLRGGGAYYPTLHRELHDGGYATRPVVAWRTPAYLSLLAWLPSTAAAQMMIGALALFAGFAGWLLIWRNDHRLAFVAAPLLALSLGSAVADISVFYAEYAAGMLMLLSAASFGLGWRRTGIVAAVAALFVRELAAPYVLVCLFLAWRDRRWREVAVWLAAIAAYAAYYLWHYAMVNAQLGPGDFAWGEGWFLFGGARFVLSTVGHNGLLAMSPLWIAAFILPLGVLALLAWPGDERIALTVFGYVVAFAIVGKPLNRYWGELYMPMLMLALPWAIPAAADLLRAAFRPSPKVRAEPAFR
jgi:hypothetical protein